MIKPTVKADEEPIPDLDGKSPDEITLSVFLYQIFKSFPNHRV